LGIRLHNISNLLGIWICAVALKAEMIITGDKALKDIGKYMGIKILGPREFLSLFR
jgi:predicted nucleic acid-binding protein